MSTPFSCPQCSKLLKPVNPVPPGARVKCPECATVFVPVPASAAPPASAAVTSSPPVTSSPAPTPSKLDTRAPNARVAGIQSAVQKLRARPLFLVGIIGSLAAVFFFICAGGVGTLYLVFRSKGKSTDPAPVMLAVAPETKPPVPEPPALRRNRVSKRIP